MPPWLTTFLLCTSFAAPVAADPPAGSDGALGQSAGLIVTVVPGRVVGSPGGLSDAFSVNITNTTTHNTPVMVKVEGTNGWTGFPVRLDEVGAGGSVMLSMYIRAPGLRGAPADNMMVSAVAEFDGVTRGWASFIAARRACLGDWNGFGGMNAQDVREFVTDVLRGNADFDGDGATTLSDFQAYWSAYFAGCG